MSEVIKFIVTSVLDFGVRGVGAFVLLWLFNWGDVFTRFNLPSPSRRQAVGISLLLAVFGR